MMDIPQEVFLPNELITEILSYLSVKALMQLRSVCKAWKTLISNPTFVNLHLQRSPRNTHLTLLWANVNESPFVGLSVFPIRRLLDNSPIIIDVDTFCNTVELKEYCNGAIVVGSCNGLVCYNGQRDGYGFSEYWLNFRNLAMRTASEKLGYFLDSEKAYQVSFDFSFGYDYSTGSYKVVAFRVLSIDYEDPPSMTSEVKIFNLGDNSWRKIQSFPVPPLFFCYGLDHINVVHFIGTINWLALTKTSRYLDKHINAENLVILSLSLSTETYTQLLLPKGFNEVLHVLPTLQVLRNYLCFSYDFRGTEFVIWQMREFGVRESWTQLIKVSYNTLRISNLPMDDDPIDETYLLPLYLSDNGDMLLFANDEDDGYKDNEEDCGVVYNWKYDRLERTRFSKEEISWFSTMEYVESLVPIT